MDADASYKVKMLFTLASFKRFWKESGVNKYKYSCADFNLVERNLLLIL